MIIVLALWVLAAVLVGFLIGRWSATRQAERPKRRPESIPTPDSPANVDATMAEIAEQMRDLEGRRTHDQAPGPTPPVRPHR
jgi:hypothetical protein